MRGKRRRQLEEYDADFATLLQTSRQRTVTPADWAFVARGTPTHAGRKDAFASLCEAYARRGGTVANAIAAARMEQDATVRRVLKDAVDLSRLLHTHRVVPPKGHQWRGKLHGVVEVHETQVVADLRGLGRGVDAATRAALERAMQLWTKVDPPPPTTTVPTTLSMQRPSSHPFLQESTDHWRRLLQSVALAEYEGGLEEGVQGADAILRLADAGIHPTRAWSEADVVNVVAGPLKGVPEEEVEAAPTTVRPTMAYTGTVRTGSFHECLASVEEMGCDETLCRVPCVETANALWIGHQVRECVDELLHTVETRAYETAKDDLDGLRVGTYHCEDDACADEDRCSRTGRPATTCACVHCADARLQQQEIDVHDSSEEESGYESGYEDSIVDMLSFGEEEDVCEDTDVSTLTCTCTECATARFHARDAHERQRRHYGLSA